MEDIRILQLTDLHFEKNKKTKKLNFLFKEKVADILVLTGDIDNGTSALSFIDDLIKHNYIVVYILGNGEFYNFEVDEIIYKWRNISKNKKNLYFLESESVIINDIEFFGSCLWTSFGTKHKNEDISKESKERLSEHHTFKRTKDFNCNKMKNLHHNSLIKLKKLINKSTARKKIMLSHYLPSYNSIDPNYKDSKFIEMFASEIDDFFFSECAGIDYWFHGHTHTKVLYKENYTNIICNPLGRKEDDNNNYSMLDGIINIKKLN